MHGHWSAAAGFTQRWQVDYPFGDLPNVDAVGSNLFGHYFDLTDAHLVRPSAYVVFGREATDDRLMTALATASGKPGRTFSASDQEMILTSGRTGLVWSGSKRAARLTGQDVLTGRRIWEQKADRWDCVGQGGHPLVAGQSIASTTLRRTPLLIDIDARTGEPLWRATGAEDLLGLGTDWLITKASEGAERIQLFDPR